MSKGSEMLDSGWQDFSKEVAMLQWYTRFFIRNIEMGLVLHISSTIC